jgi:hypothetical protein
MVSYKSIPNYKERCDIGDRITSTLYAERVPEPHYISRVFGDYALDAYFLMHALMRLVDRRDKKFAPIHSYDSAFKSFYRYSDPKLPSGFLLSPREVVGVLVHDLGEDFGGNILGALIVNDVILSLVGKDAGRDAGYLTDNNELLSKSIKKRVEKMEKFNHAKIDPSAIYNMFYSRYKKYSGTTAPDIKKEYKRVNDALKSFEKHVREEVDYMGKGSKDDLLARVNSMVDKVSVMEKNDQILEPRFVSDYISTSFDKVMDVLRSRRYIEADPQLVPPRYSRVLVSLDKTLYADYINTIIEDVKRESILARQKGQLDNDDYLAIIMEKLADGTDNSIKMEIDPLINATNVFRNARALTVGGTELVKYLKEQNIGCERLKKGVDYLFRCLDVAVNGHLAELKRRPKYLSEGHWNADLVAFDHMAKKMDDLEHNINSIIRGNPGFLTRIKTNIFHLA